jgi:hypothetical protein
MPRCANPGCPDASLSDLTMRHHWVQVQEIDLAQVGQAESAGTVSAGQAVVQAGLQQRAPRRRRGAQPGQDGQLGHHPGHQQEARVGRAANAR